MKPALFTMLMLLHFSLQLSAQDIDSTLNGYHSGFSKSQAIPPLILSVSGIAFNGNSSESVKKEIAEERNEHFSTFHTRMDNYLQFAPFALAYSLDAAGIKSRTDIANRTAIAVKGELIMLGTVSLLKNLTHQVRPDGSAKNSFPSGHTAQAFAAAAFLSEEYKYRFKWMPYVSYGMATGVGMLRVANNRHYISDVLLGAGIGILSMKAAYWTHKYKWGKKKKDPLGF